MRPKAAIVLPCVVGLFLVPILGITWMQVQPMVQYNRNVQIVLLIDSFHEDREALPVSKEELTQWAKSKNLQFSENLLTRNRLDWSVTETDLENGIPFIVMIEGDPVMAEGMNDDLLMLLGSRGPEQTSTKKERPQPNREDPAAIKDVF